jgi:tetratricopeptide (TPR) repeat protein
VLAGWAAAFGGVAEIKGQVVGLLDAGDVAGADAVVAQLLGDAEADEVVGQALQQIAGEYKGHKEFEKALALAEAVVGRWPEADFAVWAQMEVAVCALQLERYAEASAAVDKLIADYSNSADFAWVLYSVAERYDWGTFYDEAAGYYVKVVEMRPGGAWAEKARLGVVRANILSAIEGKVYSVAMEELEGAVVDYAGHADMPQTLYAVGERLTWVGRFKDARYVFGRLIGDHPASTFAETAQIWAARAEACELIQAGRDSEALAAIDGLIADFAGDVRLAETLYWISKQFEWRKGQVEDRSRGI